MRNDRGAYFVLEPESHHNGNPKQKNGPLSAGGSWRRGAETTLTQGAAGAANAVHGSERDCLTHGVFVIYPFTVYDFQEDTGELRGVWTLRTKSAVICFDKFCVRATTRQKQGENFTIRKKKENWGTQRRGKSIPAILSSKEYGMYRVSYGVVEETTGTIIEQ